MFTNTVVISYLKSNMTLINSHSSNAMDKISTMVQSAKTAAVVSTSTTATGFASILDLIPDNIGKLATLAGLVLSIVLIYFHLKKGRLEAKKLELELKILKKKVND